MPVACVLAAFGCTRSPAGDTAIGVAHIGPRYAFTEADVLTEGAQAIADLGARCIKVCLSLDTDNPTPRLYARNARWPEVASLEALAATPHMRSLFDRDFDIFILTSFRPGRPASYWRERFTEADARAEEECYATLATHLLRTYAGTRKTFVIQTWEGDWAVRGHVDPRTPPPPAATAAMIRWLAARQRGVARARAAHPGDGARVFHACEVNLVHGATPGAGSVTTDVLPAVALDLVSYSAWDTMASPADFAAALAFIARHARPTGAFPGRPVYVGEFGVAESRTTAALVAARTAACFREAERFGCPYAVYWQLYCNEPVAPDPRAPDDFRGFWLVRPDGTRGAAWELVSSIAHRADAAWPTAP